MHARRILASLALASLTAGSPACRDRENPREPGGETPTVSSGVPPLASARHETPGGPQAGSVEGTPGRGSGLTWSAPPGWKEEPPANPMRHKQYRLPGAGGDAELVVSYFGSGQGGDATSNAQRWGAQFSQPEGGSPQEALSTTSLDVGGVKVLLVETSGTYTPMMASPEDVQERPGYALVGAIVEGPDANWFFKLTGPEGTVREQRPAFLQMIQSIKRGT